MKSERIVKNRLKPNKKFYEWCESNFPKYKFKKGGKIVNSFVENKNNKYRTAIERQVRSNTNFDKLYTEQVFVIVLATKKRIEIQSYVFWQSINPITLQESIESKLWNIELFYKNSHYKVGLNLYTNRYSYGLRKNGNMMGPYTYTHLYDQDYNEVFKDSELRHFNMNERFDLYSIDRLYKYRLGLEHLQRRKNLSLFNDILSGRSDMRRVTRRYIRENDSLIRSNYGFSDILTYEIIRLHKSASKPNLKAIKLLSDNTKILNKHLGRPYFNRLQNYLVKQNQTLEYYDDYIEMLHQIGNETNEDIVLFPRNLTEEHDDLVAVINTLKIEERTKLEKAEVRKMEVITERLKSYGFKGLSYQVVAPENLMDIVNEGIELSHCVGSKSYLNKHKSGDECIMFIRKLNDESTPFYTMTYVESKHRVTQIHGYSNRVTDEDALIKEFIESDWLPFVKKIKEKQNAGSKRNKTNNHNKKRNEQHQQTSASH